MKNRSTNSVGTSLSWLTLVASTGTLLCCALPILLVSLGFGTTVAAMTSAFPIFISLSQYKAWIFILSGGLLIGTAWLMQSNKGQCPAEPGVGELCQKTQKWNRRIWLFAVVIWLIGFSASYLALPIWQWFER